MIPSSVKTAALLPALFVVVSISSHAETAPPPPKCSTPTPAQIDGCPRSTKALVCPKSTPDISYICLQQPDPPPPIELDCTPYPGGLYCQAWSEPYYYGQLQYRFTTTGPLSINYVPSSSDWDVYVTCAYGARGTVSVRVATPWGTSATKQIGAQCGNL